MAAKLSRGLEGARALEAREVSRTHFALPRSGLPTVRLLFVVVVLASLESAFAQETPTNIAAASSSPRPRTVRISFVPPPIEGTISLGIYDASGKLVRVLNRESETDDFTIGHDALVTEWDGKNDAGEDLSAGKYRARGYAVGSLSIEGVAYFFNDWVTDDQSPHIARIDALALNGNQLHLESELSSHERTIVIYDLSSGTVTRGPTTGNSPPVQRPQPASADLLLEPISSAPGKDATRWAIDHVAKDSDELVVKQLSPRHEILRQLSYQATDPKPRAIAASETEDKIFLLEENPNLQRVRGLRLIASTSDPAKEQSVSDWKIEFEKKIVAHKDFSLENGKPVATAGKATPEKIMQRLQPNPLKQDKSDKVEVAVGFDSDGSYLKTSDGLPLRTISDTTNLSRALLISHDEKSIDVFQDDGAVVEQFRISGADQMMSFDCGDVELK